MREVPVQVNIAGIAPAFHRRAVGVHGVDRPDLSVASHSLPPKGTDDPPALWFIAMHLADDEQNSLCRWVALPPRNDRAALSRVASQHESGSKWRGGILARRRRGAGVWSWRLLGGEGRTKHAEQRQRQRRNQPATDGDRYPAQFSHTIDLCWFAESRVIASSVDPYGWCCAIGLGRTGERPRAGINCLGNVQGKRRPGIFLAQIPHVAE